MRFLNFLRRKWKWVVGVVVALLFILLIIWVVKAYNKEEPIERSAEQAAPAVIIVVPAGRTATHASAKLSIPGGHFVFHFEDENGVIVSDGDAGPTQGYEGDMELFLLPEAQGKKIFPVVYFNGQRFEGSPLLP
jgi:hypothetical protein